MTGSLAHIFRHPIKAHGREALASVLLCKGAALPWDRHWAVTHDLSKFDIENPAWVSCANFQRAARTPALMAITACFDEGAGRLTLRHPELGLLEFQPETEGARLIEWLAPISPQERFAPQALVKVPGVPMTDSNYPSVSVMNLASNLSLSQHMGADLSVHRWRGNLWLDGFEAWEENEWLGRRLRIGATVLEVKERIGRCKATTSNPDTGRVDLDTLAGLRDVVGAQDFGIFAVVVEGGQIVPGDRVEVL